MFSDKKITRKDFLKMLGMFFLAIFLPRFIQKDESQNSGGYGNSSYGGNER